jgi:hypothetical protein
LTCGDRSCFPSASAGESGPLNATRLSSPKARFDTERVISALMSGADIRGAGCGELSTGETRGLIEGSGGICVEIGGTGGMFVSCGNETANEFIRENTLDALPESLHSTGDLIAMILVGEVGELSKEIGDEGAEDTRLITLFCGKIAIPHLLVGRIGAGVNNGGVTGGFGSGGGGGGSGRIAASVDS